MSRTFLTALPLCLALTGLYACSSSDPIEPTSSSSATTGSNTTGTGTGGGGGAGGSAPAGCTDPIEVPCSDEVILSMNLQADITPGLITSVPNGSGFNASIDATAGGPFTTDPDSYTYGKFTDTGLIKVEISDEDSLDSMDWDIAFRRYVVRINSNFSGPSCVAAARVPGAADYDAITALPDGLTFRTDDYFTPSCELIPDGSGLENSPATALSGYWTYPGCVSMTGNVYVIQLADERHVKFMVVNYYEPTVQAQCDTTGMVPMMDTGAANFDVRWAFLP